MKEKRGGKMERKEKGALKKPDCPTCISGYGMFAKFAGGVADTITEHSIIEVMIEAWFAKKCAEKLFEQGCIEKKTKQKVDEYLNQIKGYVFEEKWRKAFAKAANLLTLREIPRNIAKICRKGE